MEFPTIINWNNPFLFYGMLGCIFHFYSNFSRTFCKCNSGDPDQMLHSAASGLGLQYLPTFHKKDAIKQSIAKQIDSGL